MGYVISGNEDWNRQKIIVMFTMFVGQMDIAPLKDRKHVDVYMDLNQNHFNYGIPWIGNKDVYGVEIGVAA
ncbi:hypothetical protein A2U01_0053143 [Trifolium medium]|uniref:Uncharacterized protein n=1 Tax=Trifolium medium TaxID=97028 RepID=A0A392R5R0_9FABA|nr:hypothetical protein [Trifolium medium]